MATENIIINIRANVKAFARQMAMPTVAMRKMYNEAGVMNKTFRKNITTGQRFGLGLRKMTHGLRGFRMEMLGVMFFGMGLQRFFTGLLRPALELVGVFKIFQTTLAILFLPIALKILDWALWFMDIVANMSEELKLWIGKMVLIGAALGIGLFLIGMFALGVGSLILMLSGLFNIIDKLIPDFSVFGVSMSSFIEAGLGIGIITTLIGYFKGAWDRVKEILGPILKKFYEITGISFEDIKEKVKELGKEFADGLNINLGDTLTEFDDIKNSLTGAGGLTEKFGDFFDKIEKNLPSLLDLSENLNSVADAVNRIMDALGPAFGVGKSVFEAARGFEAQYLGQTPLGGGAAAIAPFIPASPINISTNVTINATTPVDADELAANITDPIVTQIGNLSRR